jgi:hypothetical protein
MEKEHFSADLWNILCEHLFIFITFLMSQHVIMHVISRITFEDEFRLT